MKPIPFEVSVPPEKQIKDLDTKLLADEGPGILALAVRGFQEWRSERRLNEPSEVRAAAQSYRNEQDLVFEFIEDSCEKAEHEKVKAAALFNSFIHWKEGNGNHVPWSKKLFGLELKRLGFESRKSGEHFWCGLRLNHGPAPDEL